jgi:hypothetical protein
MDMISDEVDTIWPVLNIYTPEKSFKEIDGAYMRMYSGEEEFCRFDLPKNMDPKSNGNILANFKRGEDGSWSLKARGYYT